MTITTDSLCLKVVAAVLITTVLFLPWVFASAQVQPATPLPAADPSANNIDTPPPPHFVLEEAPVRSSMEKPPSSQSNVQLPDSPGIVKRQSATHTPTQLASDQETEPPQDSTLPPAPPTPSPPEKSPHEPLGTAAAESIPTMGIAASRPAGAALAPAKQKRVRSILIKVGAVVGVGVAVATTVALSEGSPSRPPGAH